MFVCVTFVKENRQKF